MERSLTSELFATTDDKMKVSQEANPLSIEGLSPQEANRSLRIQLAAVHRGLAEYGLSDRVVNHLSAIAPSADGRGNVLLITPFPIDFKDVTPGSLLGIDIETAAVKEGNGALHQINGSFHLGFYQTRPDTLCMMHTHSPYVCALACLEEPKLMMVNQETILFYGNVSYDMEYGGLVADLEEGRRLGSLLGNNTSNLIMAHHGSLSTGNSIASAFNYQIALEMSAKIQVRAMQTGQKIREIPKEMCELTSAQLKKVHATPLSSAHLKSIIDRLAKTEPDFKL